jgi:hypothetical protein
MWTPSLSPRSGRQRKAWGGALAEPQETRLEKLQPAGAGDSRITTETVARSAG